jgi:hypothetical protein
MGLFAGRLPWRLEHRLRAANGSRRRLREASVNYGFSASPWYLDLGLCNLRFNRHLKQLAVATSLTVALN